LQPSVLAWCGVLIAYSAKAPERVQFTSVDGDPSSQHYSDGLLSCRKREMGLLERLGFRSAAFAAALQNDAVEIAVREDTHTFEAQDGRRVWCGGYSPIDEDGRFYTEAEHRTSDPRTFFCRVAGVTHYPQALSMACFAQSSPIALRAEPNNPVSSNAVAVYDGSGKTQVGYVPAELASTVAAVMHDGVQLVGFVMREYRERNSRGKRLGIHISIFPAGRFRLSIED
jgi:HIRAN domain